MNATVTRVIIAGAVMGLAVGIGAYTFVYAKGSSYLTDDPGACANCHIMQDHFDAWVKSSHHGVAVCNDCHTPKNFILKYASKADNGFWHSFAFTTGDFPDPIQIKPRNHNITENACRKCHQAIVTAIESPHHGHDRLDCVRCHHGVGHPLRN
jgi:cytochrome c nitrite reductase small subunit